MKKRIIALFTFLALIISVVCIMPDSNAGIQTLNLSKQTKEIKVGESFQLSMNGVKASSIKWKSSKPSVASVSKKGVVKGLKAGTTNITGKYKSLQFTIKVTVIQTLKNNKKGKLIFSDSSAELYYTGIKTEYGQSYLSFNIINKLKKTSSFAFDVIYLNGEKLNSIMCDTAMPNMECNLLVEIPKGTTVNEIKGILYAFQNGLTVYSKEFTYTAK